MKKCPYCGCNAKDDWSGCIDCGRQFPKDRPAPNWQPRKGRLCELRRAYLKEKSLAGLTLYIEPPGSALSPPVDLILEPLSMVDCRYAGAGRFHVDALPFLRFCGPDLGKHLPNQPLVASNDVLGLLQRAYWADRTGNAELGAPKDLLDTAQKMLPSLDPGSAGQAGFELHSQVAIALSELLKDQEGAQRILGAASRYLGDHCTRELLGEGHQTFLDGHAFLPVARGFLEALGDQGTALSLADRLAKGLKDAPSYLGLARLYLDLGQVEAAKGIAKSLHKKGNLTVLDGITITMVPSDWRQLMALWLDLGEDRMANLALDAPDNEDMFAPPEPLRPRTLDQLVGALYDQGPAKAH